MKAKTYRITERQLLAAGACRGQLARFRKAWPKGASLSLANLRKAVELRLDLNWFAQHFLTPPARQAYKAARVTAWQAYEAATAPAGQAYMAATATAWQAYKAARTAALKAYEVVTAPAWQAYKAATTAALWNIIQQYGLEIKPQ